MASLLGEVYSLSLRQLVIKYSITISLSVVLLLMAIFPYQAVAAPDKIRLTNGEWAPYQSEQLPNYGPASFLMTRAFAESGIDVEYGFFPWNRAMKLVERGAWDGTFIWVLTPERVRKFLISDPLFSIQEVVFFAADRPISGRKPEDLKGLVMGALDSSAFGTQFNDLVESGGITVARVRNNKQLFQMLSNGRVDFVPELETSGYEAVREFLTPEQQKEIRHLDTLTFPWTYHLLVSRIPDDGPLYIDAFNRGLSILKDSGEFEKIMGPVTHPKVIE